MYKGEIERLLERIEDRLENIERDSKVLTNFIIKHSNNDYYNFGSSSTFNRNLRLPISKFNDIDFTNKNILIEGNLKKIKFLLSEKFKKIKFIYLSYKTSYNEQVSELTKLMNDEICAIIVEDCATEVIDFSNETIPLIVGSGDSSRKMNLKVAYFKGVIITENINCVEKYLVKDYKEAMFNDITKIGNFKVYKIN